MVPPLKQQHQYNLRACQKYRLVGPTPDLLNQYVPFNRPLDSSYAP